MVRRIPNRVTERCKRCVLLRYRMVRKKFSDRGARKVTLLFNHLAWRVTDTSANMQRVARSNFFLHSWCVVRRHLLVGFCLIFFGNAVTRACKWMNRFVTCAWCSTNMVSITRFCLAKLHRVRCMLRVLHHSTTNTLIPRVCILHS